MSTISASTTTTTAYVVTADTTGALVLQTGASPTTAVTIGTSQQVTCVNSLQANAGLIGITTTAGGYGVRAQADSANTYSGIQFTNYAGTTDWSYIRSYSQNTLSFLASAGGSGISVGIGTSTPSSSYSLDTTGTIRSQADVYAGFVNGSSGGVWLARNNYTYPAVQALTSSGAANALLLNPASGSVGLGGTSIIRAVTFNTSEIAMASGTTGNYLNLCDASGNNGSSYSFYIRGLASAGSAQATLASFNAVAGAVYNGANSLNWNVTSDSRIKKNIVDNNEGLEKITNIRVRNFEYRTAEEITDFPNEENIAIQREGVQLGVIAQELQQVLPNCVYEQKNGMLSLSTDNMMWYMINAIKQLSAELDALKEKVGA